MSQGTPREPLSPQVATGLTDFARACKAATRAVSLYPAGHPAIVASLARLVETTARAVAHGPLTISVLPGALLVDQRAPERADGAIAELAVLLHEHLIGELQLVEAADPEAWREFLLLLAQSPGDVQAQGGIARLWAAAGRQHVQVREVDYAEVLREREAGIAAHWGAIIDNCLEGDGIDLDEDAVRALLEIAGDPARLAELTDQLEERAAERGGVRVQAQALLRLLRQITDTAARRAPESLDAVLGNIARAAARLTPEVMLEVLPTRHDQPPPGSVNVVDEMVTRMTDGTISQFVARSIVDRRGATERLAQAFQTLVPESGRRQHLLALARGQVEDSPLGRDASFPELWQRASEMLTSYEDEAFVSDAYARELSDARAHAEEVQRIADDPPERIAAWLSSVTDAAVRESDLRLLLDLLAIEHDPARWSELVDPVVVHIDDLVLLGDLEAAEPLVDAIVREMGPEGRTTHRPLAVAARDRLLHGHFMSHMVSHLRTIDDEGFERAKRICVSIGPSIIRPLAEALAVEERGVVFRRLTDLLAGFGAAGREAVEQLKHSANPAVRRTAIHLLREFGGQDALPELTSLLDDAEPNVQREAIRAIALIGTDQAFAVLQTALSAGTPKQREAIVSALGAMRDERAVPLFCHMVTNDEYRRSLRSVYLTAVEHLGALGGREAVAALAQALYRGEWWAPGRTAAARRAVATALRRIGTPEALEALRAAAARGRRGVRAAAREQLLTAPASRRAQEARR